jgi:hypothetical protein
MGDGCWFVREQETGCHVWRRWSGIRCGSVQWGEGSRGMSLRCAVRACDKEAEARDRLLMKRLINQGGREWQSRARVQTEGRPRDQQQNSCGDRHTKKELEMVHNGSLDRLAAGHVRLKAGRVKIND